MKKYLKKSLSVFLSFLMVLSCFVFTPEMFTFEADAAQQGQYYYRFTVYLTDNWSNAQENSQVRIFYKTKNGKGGETTAKITYNPAEGWWDRDENATYTVCEGTVPGFPYKVEQYGKTSWLRTMEYKDAKLYVGSSLNNMTEVASGGTFKVGSSGNVTKTVLEVASGNYPTPTSISWAQNTSAHSVRVPDTTAANYDSSKSTATFSAGSTVLDQYGVSWYQPANYAFYDGVDRSTANAVSVSGLSVATTGKEATEPAADQGKVTVTNTAALKNYVAYGKTTMGTGEPATTRTVYAFATLNGVYSSTYARVDIENPTYTWTFDANGGEFHKDAKTSVTQYYGTTLTEEQIPTAVTKTGYTFDYFANSGTKCVAGSTKFTGAKTWYAQWSPIENKVNFYNYNGQPLYELTAHYDDKIGDIMTSAGVKDPTRPSTSAASYKFVRWVDWETGEELDENEVLQNLDSTKIRKFIAEYEVDDGQAFPTYNYNFYVGGLRQQGSGSGPYRTEIAFPANPTKATEGKDNGYSYEFAGWIVKKDDGTKPADVIIDTTKGETLEEFKENFDGKKFLDVNDGDFSYYLKENIMFYPVFVAKYKQVTVTLHYRDTEGEWQTTTVSNENTTCTKTFDLGIPNPKSYNTNDYSFTFNGWTTVKNPNEGTTLPAAGLELGDENAINITLKNDCEYWATYSRAKVQYKVYYYKDGVLLDEQDLESYEAVFTIGTEESTDKDREGMTGYTFKGWSLTAPGVDEKGDAIEQPIISGTYSVAQSGSRANPTFYAVYDSFDYYEVTFVDDEGKVLQTSKDYVKNDELTAPDVKDKDDENDAQYTEAFTGWKDSKGTFHKKDDKLTVSGNEKYTAVFEKKVRKYLIKFYDVNGQQFDENDKDKEISEPIATATLDYGTNLQEWINENKLAEKVVAAESFPKDTMQYKYTFTGWSPNINDLSVVTGTAVYRATYKTSRVEYKVHWLAPKIENNKETIYTYATSKYFYQGSIATPSGKPVYADPQDYENYPLDEYTWSFLGWYVCDKDGVLQEDDNGDYIKFAKGMIADKDNQYFLARFGYVAKKFAVTVYDSDKTTVLETFDGREANTDIDITLAYTKAPDASKHYIPTELRFMNAEDGSAAAATFENGSASYTVGTYNELYVVYKEESHTHIDDNWVTVTEPTYAENGLKENACTVCGYKKTESIAKYVDDQAPTGIVYIGGYTWKDNTADTDEVAYVKADSLVNIIVRDLGSEKDHADSTAGVGIQKISYGWVDSDSTETKLTDVPVSEKYTLDKSVNFQLPDGFEGKYLTVVVTDYNGKSYTITTNTLNVDSDKPVIKADSECGLLYFAIIEEYELNGEAKLEKLNTETNEYETLVYGTDYVAAGEEESDGYNKAYFVENADGTYRITAADMAGNEAYPVVVTVAAEHEFGDYIVTKAATCTEVGSQHKECKNCGYETDEEEIAKIDHKYPDAGSKNEYTIDKEATCTQEGSKSIHCTVCDEIKEGSVTVIDAKGHDEVVKEVEPTCEKGGYKLTTCKDCDLWILVTEGYEAIGHKADETKHVKKDSTCSEEGYEYDICAKCEAKINEVTIAKKAHTYVNETPKDSCTGTDGEGHFYSVWKCSVCDNVETNYPELAAHDYSVKSEEPIKEATCGANAVYRYTCSREGCGKYIDKEERYTALTHNYEWITDTDATCTEKGSKHQECTICHDKKDAVEIPATGHHLVKDEDNYKEATCGTAGVDAKKCDNKGCTYTEAPEIPATGTHNYTEKLTGEGNYLAATCEADGYQVYKCNGCDATKKETIAALGHKHADDDEGTVTKVPDCKNKGEITYDCVNGSHKYTEVLDIDRDNHDTEGATVVKVIKAATCTEAGSEIRNCNRCGSAVTVTTAALDHDYSKWTVTTKATCVKDGVETLVCSRCGDVKYNESTDAETGETIKVPETRAIAATGKHTLKTHAKVDATCTKDGTDTYYECTVCSKLFSDAEGTKEITAIPTIKSEGHKFGDYITVAPTCSADGYKYKVCSVCGNKSDKEATGEKALNHEGGVHTLVKVNKAATCSAVGEGVYKCSLCGELFTQSIAKDEDAHSAVWSTVPATCTEKGSRIKKCDLCGKKLAEEEIDALGHAYRITTKTELQNGKIVTITTHTCTRKGCTYSYSDDPQVVGDACKVTFVVNGVTSEITIEKGAKLKKSDLPSVDLTSTNPAYEKSVKWMMNGSEITLPMTVENNITINAVISESPVKFTVKFVNTLSKDTVKSDVYGYDAKVTAPEDLVVPGYTFNGWSVSPADPEVTVYDKNTIPNATADVTYYAVFTAVAGAKTYYVTFKNTAGTKVYSTAIVAQGGTVDAPTEIPTKTSNSVFHYTFAGWFDKDGKAVTFPMTITSNVTVYAKFNDVKHSDNKVVVPNSTKAPTCTTPGELTYRCSCGYEWVYYTEEALGHDYREVSRVETAEKLTITYKCANANCDSEWTKTVVYNTNANIIVVNVKDTAGNAVEGASVQLYIGNLQTMTATTDAKGQAKFPKYDAETNPNGLKDGNYTVKVTKSGYNDASGTLVIKDGTGMVNLTFAKIDCHCICHSSNVFGKIRRFFNKLIRSLFNKNYTCCDCGECEAIH